MIPWRWRSLSSIRSAMRNHISFGRNGNAGMLLERSRVSLQILSETLGLVICSLLSVICMKFVGRLRASVIWRSQCWEPWRRLRRRRFEWGNQFLMMLFNVLPSSALVIRGLENQGEGQLRYWAHSTDMTGEYMTITYSRHVSFENKTPLSRCFLWNSTFGRWPTPSWTETNDRGPARRHRLKTSERTLFRVNLTVKGYMAVGWGSSLP